MLFPWARVGVLIRKKLVPEDQMLQKTAPNWMHDSATIKRVSWKAQLITGVHEGEHTLRVAMFFIYRETGAETNPPSTNKGMAPWSASGSTHTKPHRKHCVAVITVKKPLHGGIYRRAAEMPWVSSGNALYIQDWCFPQTVFFPCVGKLRQENMFLL